jgi:hypothetical protein
VPAGIPIKEAATRILLYVSTNSRQRLRHLGWDSFSEICEDWIGSLSYTAYLVEGSEVESFIMRSIDRRRGTLSERR